MRRGARVSAGPRALWVALLVALAVGALTAAVASAVRSGRGAAPGRVVAVDVMPAVRATGPTASPPRLGAAPALPATPGPRLSASPVPALAASSPPPVVAEPAPSRAVGLPFRGRLVNGVLLPADGADHTTWDAVEQGSPNRDWRRVGTDRLVATLLRVAAAYRAADPGAPRVVISDLSLPQGGRFGTEYGGMGHASHQNGLDVDIAYPRRDGREVGVDRVGEIDRARSQALVDAFVRAGAQYVFVGPRTRLRGPQGVVQALGNHDDHLHLRLPPG